MSDLCSYEIEDAAWDDFCRSGDHIVPPNPCGPSADEHQLQGANHKKPRHEISSTGYAKKPKEQDENNCRMKLLAEGSWCDAPSHVFPTSHQSDTVNRVSNLSSESNTMESIGRDFCETGHILDDQKAGVDGNSNSYQFFLDDDNDEKNGSDTLEYGWPEIGNFEDVDRMFRNCDSTFGHATSDSDGDISGWLSSLNDIEGSKEASRTDVKFSCLSPNAPENILGSGQSGNSYREDLWVFEKGESDIVNHLSFVEGSHSSDCKDGSIPERKTNSHKKQSKPNNRSEGQRTCIFMENGASFPFNGSLHDAKRSTSTDSPQSTITSICTQRENQFPSDSFAYLQNCFPYMHSEYNHYPDRSSNIMSESNALVSVSPKGSHVPNQLLPIKRHLDTGFSSENHIDLDGANIKAPMGPSMLLASSSFSSGLDEVSEEATCFHQLRHAIDQIDLETKLCIRDSLYRLAQSAEQRHRHANFNGDNRDASGTDRCVGHLGMETDTNPIDRSIAQLLFHEPSDSSSPVIQGFITSTCNR
ncbi:unnamed protein product [Cuscuta epithymum]|uniref:Protein LNK1 n=2 Tax=Cuscuta epithymum TaxID=186058 RepID=A0AAV0EQX9_9ASTE|nr:unnamed protein product [Cuscuta epithymum]CAH9125647.1 unnamed protein product [Cuscuta epithymum]